MASPLPPPDRLKLGKAPPKYDERTLKLATYLPAALPATPRESNYLAAVSVWPMFGNDEYGDCVEAGAAHLIESWSANASQEVAVSIGDVLAAYTAVAGFDPSNPATDRGTVMLDFLNWWRQTGFGGHTIAAYVQINPRNRAEVMAAIYLFGGVYLGIALPVSAQTQQVWEVPSEGLSGDGTPNSWGGHCVPSMQYNGSNLGFVTWGRVMDMSWGFFESYVDEAYAILSPDWFNGSRQAPNGFDLQALQTDLAEITGAQPPNQGPVATVTDLAATPNPAPPNQPIAVTVRVTGVSPTGTVVLMDGGAPVSTESLSSGTASVNLVYSDVARHPLTASYSGDAENLPSTSQELDVRIQPQVAPTVTTFTVSPNPAQAFAAVTLKAEVAGDLPTGTVSFNDAGTILEVVTLANGVATTSFEFAAGGHALTAKYGGDAVNEPSEESTSLSVSSSSGPVDAFWNAWGPYGTYVGSTRNLEAFRNQIAVGNAWLAYFDSLDAAAEKGVPALPEPPPTTTPS